MRDDQILEIVDLCLSIEESAFNAYGELSSLSEIGELKAFWLGMSEDEKRHIGFWQRLKVMAEEQTLPQVLDDPAETREELEKISRRTVLLLNRFERSRSTHDAFILAYRLEFYMLHSAFEILFHNLRVASGEENPEDDYELHINRFVQMLTKHGQATPELELLGETLQRMWQENRKLAQLSFSDSLTGVQNMRGFMSLCKQLSYLAHRDKKKVGIMMIDIDDFKRVNDQYGHQKGDAILKAVASTIRSSLRRSDVVGRYGGEEFIVYVFGAEGSAIKHIAEKMRGSIEKQTLEGIPLTVSIGVAGGEVGSNVEKDMEDLIGRADNCLYFAKRRGKNRVVSGDPLED
jgi:diguanylate cyclase (GGDEF)-like protein